MTNYIRIFTVVLISAVALKANAQTGATTSSPYSKYGIGDISDQLLPQNVGMGGIGVGTNVISGFSTINFVNPAANALINFTTVDVGVYGSSLKLNRTGQGSETNNNFRLNHLAFAIPITKKSALTFGLNPYSQVGYQYRQQLPNFGTGLPADTNAVNFKYSGEGGITKAFLGYGFGFGNVLLGGRISYMFGNIKNYSTSSIPALYGTYNTRIENGSSVAGFSYDYGIQYLINVGEANRIVLGYSGTLGSKIKIQNSQYVSHFTANSDGDDNVAVDSVVSTKGPKSNLQLPQIHRFGVSYKMGEKLLVGADYSTGKWSDMNIDGVSVPNVKNSQTINVGAQLTPNINKLNNYFALCDYRVGFIYNDTYLHVNNTNIKQYAATVGMGFPLKPGITNASFYKINVSAEIGQRGSLVNSLVKENYINIRLGFTLNDKWFQRYKFD